ncbi:hypothetical protein Q0Y04_22835 [Clostridioides difficile]|nr:hypothetical protein Q0Y04_22835 [Clostridioides difficile]
MNVYYLTTLMNLKRKWHNNRRYSKKFNLSRTQSSRLLNDLVKSDNLIKINSRPVIFLPKNKINDVVGPTKKVFMKI